jgi:DNA-binding transcriptional ArsR family regulator
MFVRNEPNKANSSVRQVPLVVEIMSSPLPHRPSIDHAPRQRLTVDFDSERSETILDALGSETARSILRVLEGGPAPASEIARQSDISVQTVSYHLDNLVDAGLVSAVGIWYSSKGAEMDVYALTGERVEVCLASDERTSGHQSQFGPSSSPEIVIDDD